MATRKQKELLKQIIANPSISGRKALVAAGYSINTAIDPAQILQSKSFQELAAEYLPVDRILDVARDGLEAMKITRDKFGDKYEDPDFYARHQYLETALRIRNLAQRAETPLGDVNIQVINYKDTTEQAEGKAIDVKTKEPGGDTP